MAMATVLHDYRYYASPGQASSLASNTCTMYKNSRAKACSVIPQPVLL